MQTIIPLKVPWEVTYSTLFSSEILEEHNVRIYFEAVFLDTDEVCSTKPPRRNEKMSCLFEVVAATRSHPAGKNDEVIDRKKFDWSNLKVQFDDGKPTANDFRKNYYEEWTKSRLNPDPRFYEVLESDWLLQEKEKDNWYITDQTKHFLFLGSDFSFEVLAKNVAFSER